MKKPLFWFASASLLMIGMVSAQAPQCTGPGCVQGQYIQQPGPQQGYWQGPQGQPRDWQVRGPQQGYALPQSNQGFNLDQNFRGSTTQFSGSSTQQGYQGYSLPQSNQGIQSPQAQAQQGSLATQRWDEGINAMPKDETKTDADREIARKIREAFHDRREIDARKVIIVVTDKKVTLKGQVLTDRDGDALILVAKNASNIKDINNQLTSAIQNGQSPSYQMAQPSNNGSSSSDQRFNRNANDQRFNQGQSGRSMNQPSSVRDQDFDLRNQNQSGRWSNQPLSPQEKGIESPYYNYKGSHSRNNLADMGAPKSTATPDLSADNRIAKKVQDAIQGGIFSTRYNNVTFDVANNAVTLKGTVENEKDKRSLQESIAKIDGVKNVNNQIRVTSPQK